ncbi:hypothetical protein [Bacteroides faecis]|nr:hypothetical protein [Bacteroides faecis]MCS2237519.1 hypothetical protein [Bacteroides faecis]MCS3126478.1 hypothetical protein [Bacteroides faecis]MCY6312672.1 hypothetical protein [Bacteroides faecis]UVQ62230.1 hypothetical protein NXY18_25585 [Bacteroides faecis]
MLSHEYAAIDPEAIFNTIKIGIHLCSLL